MMNQKTAFNSPPSALAILQEYLAWESPDILNPGTTSSTSDEAYDLIRNFLDQPEAAEADEFPKLKGFHFTTIIHCLIELNWNQYRRDEMSTLAISLSLCPMHFCDWASCFDDDDAECSQIRAIFPYGHDT